MLTTELSLRQNLKLSVIECYNRLAGMYSQRTRPEIRDIYLKPFLALPLGARIFDAGCGTGHDALVLARAGYSVMGVDISPAMCNLAQKHLSRFESVEVVEADTESVEAPRAGFNAVLSAMEIFHHNDPKTTLKRYAALLAPGGILVLVTNHPVRNMLTHPEHDYFAEGLVWENWGDQGKVPKFHWTLRTYLSSITGAALRIGAIDEHPPSLELATLQDSAVRTQATYPSLITFVCQK